MALLQHVFPSWHCDRIEHKASQNAITVLNLAGDSAGSKAHYASLAARLTAFGTNARAPSTAALPPVVAVM